MPPVICIVGRPGSGKTTLITRLIPELKARGHKIATIKHTHHDFAMDIPGKDSWKHAQAGSECAILSSATKLAMLRQIGHAMTITELLDLVPDDFDLVLAEGFKGSAERKIEVHRREVGEPVCSPRELIAVVTDESLEVEVPQFSADDISALADFIEANIR